MHRIFYIRTSQNKTNKSQNKVNTEWLEDVSCLGFGGFRLKKCHLFFVIEYRFHQKKFWILPFFAILNMQHCQLILVLYRRGLVAKSAESL